MKRVILALTFAATAGAIVSSQIPRKFDSYQVRNADGTYRVNHHSDGSLLLPEDTRVYFAPDGKTMREKLEEIEGGNGGGNGDTIIARGWDVSLHFDDNPGSGYGPDGDPTANVAAVNDAIKASFEASSHLEEPWGRCAAITITDHLLIDSTISNLVDGYRVDCVVDGKCSGHVEMVETGSGACFYMEDISDTSIHPNIPEDMPKMIGTAASKSGLTLLNMTITNPIGYCVMIPDGRRQNQAFMSKVDMKCLDFNTPDSACLRIDDAYAGFFQKLRMFDSAKHALYVTESTNLTFNVFDVVWNGRLLWGVAGDVTAATDSTITITPPRALNDNALDGTEIEIWDGTGSGKDLESASDNFVLASGTQSGTVENTHNVDGTYHTISYIPDEPPGAGEDIDGEYQFEIIGDDPTTIRWTGYAAGAGTQHIVYAWDSSGNEWDQLGTINGKDDTTNESREWNLSNRYASGGQSRIRVTSANGTSFNTDRWLLLYDILGQVRTVVSNTGNVLLISPEWHTIPDATSSYWVRVVHDAAVHLHASGSWADQVHIEDNHGLGLNLRGSRNRVSGWFENNYRWDNTNDRGTRDVVVKYDGTVISASGTTVILSANSSTTNGFYDGDQIELDTGEVRLMSNYDGPSHTADVNRAWTTGGNGNDCVIRQYERGFPGTMPRAQVHGFHNVLDVRNYPTGDPLFAHTSYFWPMDQIAAATTRIPVHDRGRNLDLWELAASDPNTASQKAYWSLAIAGESGDDLSLSGYDSTPTAGTYADFNKFVGHIDIVHRAGAYSQSRWIYPFNDSAGFIGHVVQPRALCLCRMRYSTTNPDFFVGRVTALDNQIARIQFTPQGYTDGSDPYMIRWWAHAYTDGVHEITAIGRNNTDQSWSVTVNDFLMETCEFVDFGSPEVGITIHSLEFAICNPKTIP